MNLIMLLNLPTQWLQLSRRYKKLAEADEVAFEGEIELLIWSRWGLTPALSSPC